MSEMNAYPKPALTFEQQVDHLINKHGLIVDDKKQAVDVLKRINYYRLSAYGISFRDPCDHDRYLPGTTFKQIYMLHDFDRLFRSSLMPLLEDIEIRLRTQVAYHIAIEYGPEGYLDPNHFSQTINSRTGEPYYAKIISDIEAEKTRQENLPFVKHHNQKYNGHFPIWTVIELLSFGSVVSLYSLLDPRLQGKIVSSFGVDRVHFYSWFLSFVEIRNICAHSNRLYNMPLKQTPRMYNEHRGFSNTNKVFPSLVALCKLMNGTKLWHSYVNTLYDLVTQFPDVDLSYNGFPSDWKKYICSSFRLSPDI